MDIWDFLKETTKPIVLYGMGNGAQRVIEQLEKIGKCAVGIFASDDFVRGQEFCGYTVTKYSDLVKEFPDMIILVCFGSNRQSVLDYIKILSLNHIVLCPDVPVFGDNIFDHSFAVRYKNEIKKVYDALADKESKDTFQKIIEFKLSGLTDKLRECQYDGGLFDSLPLHDDEIYVDVGAYRGDTVETFLNSVNAYRKIYAFEPNEKTYLKLCENTKNLKDFQPILSAVSDFDGEIQVFSAGRGTSISKKGKTVPVCSLDAFFGAAPITLVKMDVEGEERAALVGMKNIIAEQKPKMIIAAYHRSEDIFSIPLQVLQMQHEYKVYIRHFPHNLAWDTNFYFI